MKVIAKITKNSAKLTNQHISYIFTCNPLSIHVRHMRRLKKQDWCIFFCCALVHLFPVLHFSVLHFQRPRHILPNFNTDILAYYLFSIDISEQHAWKLWIHFSYLVLPLHGTSANNSIKLIPPVTRVPALYFGRWQYVHRSINFTQFICNIAMFYWM